MQKSAGENMKLNLAGKTAIITGGTRGIGRAIADSLADEGVNVAICARNPEEVRTTEAELAKKGIKARGDVIDAGDEEKIKAWVVDVCNTMGGIDIVIPNASAFRTGNDPDAWRAAMEIDVIGAVNATTAAMPFLEQAAKEKGDAAVVIVSSAAGGEAKYTNCYGAAKAAQVHLAKGLAREKASIPVRINLVSPGTVYFKGGAWDKIQQNMPDMYKAYMEANPMGRMGRPEEIASAVTFLASPLASFITGANLLIDGGMTYRVNY